MYDENWLAISPSKYQEIGCKSVSLHCTPGVDSSNSLAKATVGEPEKDKIVLSLGRVNIPIFAGYSLSILTILVSI